MVAVIPLAIAAVVISVVLKFWRQRSLFKDLPGPPHHPIFGHLKIMNEIANEMPADASNMFLAYRAKKYYNLPDVFYLDLWPVSKPQVVVLNPNVAAQATQVKSLDKDAIVGKFMEPLVGNESMVATNGQKWKLTRKLFVPGLLQHNLFQHVPEVIDDVKVLMTKFEKFAETQEVFLMEEWSARVIFNIITRIILGVDCNSILGDNALQILFRDQARLLPTSFWERYLGDPNPWRVYLRWVNSRKMDKEIGRIVDERFSGGLMKDDNKHGRRHVVDYALDTYNEEMKKTHMEAKELDKEFRNIVISQVRTLIFAGHDSSSAAISYSLNLLYSNPDKLAKLREEHDRVFGTDPTAAAEIMRNDPKILNKLEYTLCVLKETIRLYPAAPTFRNGEKGFTLKKDGKEYPTYPFAVLVNDYALMNDEANFKDPKKFMPERYLVTDPNDPYFVNRNAWRGFELGPRNCIGQAQAIIQQKIVLVMMVRTFDWQRAFPKGSPTVDGDETYQILHVTNKPAQDMPCRIKKISDEWKPRVY